MNWQSRLTRAHAVTCKRVPFPGVAAGKDVSEHLAVSGKEMIETMADDADRRDEGTWPEQRCPRCLSRDLRRARVRIWERPVLWLTNRIPLRCQFCKFRCWGYYRAP